MRRSLSIALYKIGSSLISLAYLVDAGLLAHLLSEALADKPARPGDKV